MVAETISHRKTGLPNGWPLTDTCIFTYIEDMSRSAPSYETAQMIGESCVCLRVQRASRAIGRRFDDAFRSLGLNNGQFSLLMSLNRPSPPTVGELAERLAMDRTTTTKNLKPLERRGLLKVRPDDKDSRARRITLTNAGRALLADAVPHWQATNDAVRASLGKADLASLHSALRMIADN